MTFGLENSKSPESMTKKAVLEHSFAADLKNSSKF